LNDLSSAQRDFLALRDQAGNALLATITDDQTPVASYAPLAWLDGHCYLFLSELASHTRNLKRCSSISLMLIEAESDAVKSFARRRITLNGSVLVIARDDPLFDRVLVEFHRRFGKVMTIIEPLPDFSLFRVCLQAGRFVRSFGQAYDLSGEHLDELVHIDLGK